MKMVLENVHKGLDTIYPNRPEMPIRPSLPPSEYAGLYYHPGYKYIRVMTAERKHGKYVDASADAKLYAKLPDLNFRIQCDFVHVSGESWIAYVDLMDGPTLTMHGFAAMKFRIGIDGEVESMGIEWRTRCGVDAWIWYKRIRTRDGFDEARETIDAGVDSPGPEKTTEEEW